MSLYNQRTAEPSRPRTIYMTSIFQIKAALIVLKLPTTEKKFHFPEQLSTFDFVRIHFCMRDDTYNTRNQFRSIRSQQFKR
jgi:hypothetical protein